MEKDACDSDTCMPRRAWRPTGSRITSGLASPWGCTLEACQPSRATCPVDGPSPSLPCPEEFVSHGRGRAINASPPRGTVSEGTASSATMQAAACCLSAPGLRVPAASACPPLGLEQGARALPLWRPWLPQAQEGPAARREEMDQARAAEADGGPGKALPLLQHPVRLLWPRSKAFDHLYSVGEKLLQNFPVQATLFFYEDSGSEEEEEEEEEEGDDEEEEATGDVTAGHPRNAGRPA